jgi:small-conductance mechanosensitive channel
MEVLDTVYLGNSVRAWLVATAIALGIVVLVRIAVFVVTVRIGKLAARTQTSLDDTIIKVLASTKSLLTLLVAVQVGSLFLVLPGNTGRYLKVIAIIAFLVQVGVWSGTAITAGALRLREKKMAAGETSGIAVISMVGLFARIVAWAIILILILDNLGVDITALVAGLGIGGIAVAFALQSVLSDAFASVAIMLDRPFEVGDTIHVGDMIGTVENVGMKTTRLRSISGEQLVFSNNDLLGSRLRNYKRMQERRSLFVVGVTYQTPVEVLEKMGGLLEQIVKQEPKARFLRQLAALEVEFAYPTQTVYEYKLGTPSS